MKGCVFCDRSKLPVDTVEVNGFGGEPLLVFEPLAPVVPGHLLVVPVRHVANASENPWVTAKVMEHAARIARDCDSANIITSIGEPATQSVFHLHVHVVPRVLGDRLYLPWTTQQQIAHPYHGVHFNGGDFDTGYHHADDRECQRDVLQPLFWAYRDEAGRVFECEREHPSGGSIRHG